MGQMTDEQQKVRELFDAHFTVSEIVERTSLEIQTVVRFINAPRIVKRRDVARERPLAESNPWAWPAIKSQGRHSCVMSSANLRRARRRDLR